MKTEIAHPATTAAEILTTLGVRPESPLSDAPTAMSGIGVIRSLMLLAAPKPEQER